MTKWILLLVVLANGLGYFWFSSQQEQRLSVANGEQGGPSRVPEGGTTLALLSERGEKAPVAAPRTDSRGPDPDEVAAVPFETQEEDVVVTASAAPDENAGVDNAPAEHSECLLVGPFAQRLDVDNLVFKLGALGVAATAEDREEEMPSSSFWVYLPPLLSEKAAARKLQELKNSGVDSFIFQDGELKNGISLGFFAARENAIKRQQELAKAGYKTQIFSAPNLVRTYWVRMPSIAQRALAESFWKELGAANPALKLERDNCG